MNGQTQINRHSLFTNHPNTLDEMIITLSMQRSREAFIRSLFCGSLSYSRTRGLKVSTRSIVPKSSRKFEHHLGFSNITKNPIQVDEASEITKLFKERSSFIGISRLHIYRSKLPILCAVIICSNPSSYALRALVTDWKFHSQGMEIFHHRKSSISEEAPHRLQELDGV